MDGQLWGNFVFCRNFLKNLHVNFVQRCQICVIYENLERITSKQLVTDHVISLQQIHNRDFGVGGWGGLQETSNPFGFFLQDWWERGTAALVPQMHFNILLLLFIISRGLQAWMGLGNGYSSCYPGTRRDHHHSHVPEIWPVFRVVTIFKK